MFPHITIFVHVGCEAFVKTTSAALITVSFVNWAAIFQVALSFASVDPGSVDAALEESRTTFTTTTTTHSNLTSDIKLTTNLFVHFQK